MADELAAQAPKLLDRLKRRMRRRGRRIARQSETELHRLRKSLKKLRYGIEMLHGLHREKSVHRFLKPIRALQESLGQLNDGFVARHLAEALGAADPALMPAVQAVRHWSEAREKKASKRIAKAWNRLRGAELF